MGARHHRRDRSLISDANADLDILAGAVIIASIVLWIILGGIAAQYARHHWD